MQATGVGDGLENEKKKNRSKRADCPTCGTKLTGKKKQTPNGKAASGRCLVCHPADHEENEDRSNVPKVLIVEIRSEDDENSAISEITLDRRLLSIDEENGVYGSRMTEDVSRHAGSTNLSYSKSSRAFKSNAVDDQDNESVLTESENDEDGANHMRRSHRSARSINNSSHHNAVSLSSSARNRWGEFEAGMDADSTGPRPQPPRRVPSTDREKNQSVRQSLPSRLTITTVNTTHTRQSSPTNRSSSPKQVSGSPNQRQGSSQKISTKVPRVVAPNSPTKKSHFIPPWNPKNPNNDNNIERKTNEERKNERDDSRKLKDERSEFVLVSDTIHDNIHVRNDMVPTIGISKKISRKSNSKNVKDYADYNEIDKDRGSTYEISLLGSNHLETKQIADIDQSGATGLLQKNGAQEKTDIIHYIEHRSRINRKQHEEIHVDLASSYATRKISSPIKNVTPRTQKRRQALHMLVQMEQIFPSEDRSLSSTKPPKKALRSGSEEIDWAIVPAEFPLFGRDIIAGDGICSNTKSSDFANKIMAMDVRQMLSSIANEESRESRIEIIRVLTFMMWTKDTIKHRTQFAEANGMEILRTLLLTEIHLDVQTAVLKLVLVLITGACELDGFTPTLSAADNVDIIVDVILAAMETHINVEEIQLLGCQVLCCLSSELSASRNAVDGSNVGACFAVLSAMEAHGESVTMQEWGIRCLYNQCVYSKHANSNKRTVLLAKLSQGKGQSVVGSDVLLRVLKYCTSGRQANLFLIEWICKLYMALCSSKGIAELFSPATDLLRNLLNIMHIQNKELSAQAELLEPALIIISSLIDIDRNKSCINITDTFVIMLDTIACRGEDLEVVALCCSLMSKLVSEPSLRKDALLGIGTARRITSVVIEYPDDLRVRESGTFILACLCHGMEGFKHQICTRETIEQLMMVWQIDMTSSENDASIFQENICTLIVSLFASESERLRARAVRYGALDLLGKVVERGMSNPRLQDLFVVGLMNLSSGSSVDCVMDDGMNYVEMIIRAMESNKSSSHLQKNGCSALWNIGVKSDIGIGQIIKSNGVSTIVSCLRNHSENQDAVGAACGTLWSLSLHDVAFKRMILRTDNAMEIIAKIILLNCGSRAVQEQACGVLASVASSISESNAHEAATCVPTLIEAMRIDSCILPVLQCGAKFLRQVVVYLPEYADPSCDTLTVLIKAMREYRSAHAFQEDACNFLWTLSEKSPTAKERILNMDGISIVMEILDKSCNLQSKENLALGSFKELTLSNS